MKALTIFLVGCLVVYTVLAKDDIEEGEKMVEKRSGKLPKNAPSLAAAFAARRCKPMFERCKEENRQKHIRDKSVNVIKMCFGHFMRTCFLKTKVALEGVERALHSVGPEVVEGYLEERYGGDSEKRKA